MIPAAADAVALRTVVPIALLVGAGVFVTNIAEMSLDRGNARFVLLSSVGGALTLNLWLLLLA